MRPKLVLTALCSLLLFAGAAFAQVDTATITPTNTPIATPTRTATPTVTPTPAACSASGFSSDLVANIISLNSLQCLPSAKGPTAGKCFIALVENVPVLNCPGQALQKFTTTAWP